MDSVGPCPPPPRKSKLAKKFHNVIHFKTSTKPPSNHGFCLNIPQEKLKCSESHEFFRQEVGEKGKESRNRAAMEAFLAKLFATISSFKAAYAELQMAQFPFNNEALKSADQALVDELKAFSQLKHNFLRKRIDLSPPIVTLMLAEVQEQQSLMKIYEITMRKMQNQIESKGGKVSLLQEELKDAIFNNKSLEMKLNASGVFSVLDNIKFSDGNPKDFHMVLHYAVRSIRNFVKFLILEMESAKWDLEAAANAIDSDINFLKKEHKGFAFESFVCREIFGGFNDPGFCLETDDFPCPDEKFQRRVFYFEQFKKMKSVNPIHFLKQNPGSSFGRFLRSKYLQLLHPKMEFSFFGNLSLRKSVNSGEFPETELFKIFAEMGRRIWILHCLGFSFDQEVSVFQVKKGCRFSEVYMESVTSETPAVSDAVPTVAFTVVPGFKVGRTVVQSQVYLSSNTSSTAK